MMETLEQKKRRLFGKQYLSTYLNELAKLINRKVYSSDLLSIQDTDLYAYNKWNKTPYFCRKISFSNKEQLSTILNGLIDFRQPYILFTHFSKDCGAIILNSFSEFNIMFSFYDDLGGLAIFIRQDKLQRIILDYYEEDNKFYIQIEAYKGFDPS